MIVFGVEVNKPDGVFKGFIESAQRTKLIGVNQTIRLYEKKETSVVIVGLEFLFPPLWRYVAAVLAAILVLFNGFGWHIVLAIIPLVFEVIMLKRSHTILFKRGLKKAGFTGEMRVLDDDETLRLLLNGSV